MNTNKNILIILCFILCSTLTAQNLTLSNKLFEVNFSENGSIKKFIEQGNNIEFRNDSTYSGPSIYFSDKRIKLHISKSNKDTLIFIGENQNLNIILGYWFDNNTLAIHLEVKNKSDQDLQVKDLMLRLGINTEMDAYPHWHKVFFPTLMRCEKDFFWGYLMNPDGGIISVVSPDPIASWNNSYSLLTEKEGGHRIFTTNLDLMHQLPLPERHPQNMDKLMINESRLWTIYFKPVNNLNDIKKITSSLSKAVIINAPLYTIAENETFLINVVGEAKSLIMITPNQKTIELNYTNTIKFKPSDGVGKYKLIAKSITGKTTEAVFSVRKPWSWYIQQARLNAIDQQQKGSSHTESWYGLFSMFLAEKHYPDRALLKMATDKFEEIYPLMYDNGNYPKTDVSRIQNTASMSSLLAVIYSTLKDTAYLVKAASMCDFLITNQDKDGAYRNGNVNYTSVIYIAKSIIEVCQQEKLLAKNNNIWQKRYTRHFASAKKAIDNLTRCRDNVETEGEMTYEDGMISCTYTQIALMATLTDNKIDRDKYIEAAEYLRNGHRCISQLLIPDSRMNGGSLRFWESQYDILSYLNMMSSPHGWSAWQVYGMYYLYQVTGNKDLLDQIYNTLGSCVQLIDEKTGKLRWAFCVDPYLKGNNGFKDNRGGMFVINPGQDIHENRGIRTDSVVGEQYINMISGWYKAKPNTWVTGYWGMDGGCCDNDVHEIFKCLEETALSNAFVVEQNDRSIKGYNCSIRLKGNKLEITPYENVIDKVHFNLKRSISATIHFSNKDIKTQITGGEMKWIMQN